MLGNDNQSIGSLAIGTGSGGIKMMGGADDVVSSTTTFEVSKEIQSFPTETEAPPKFKPTEKKETPKFKPSPTEDEKVQLNPKKSKKSTFDKEAFVEGIVQKKK